MYLDAIAKGGGGGGGGGVLVVHDVDGTLDKTWQEIHDAFVSGGVIIDSDGKLQNAVIGIENGKAGYSVTGAGQPNWIAGTYIANAADGYPASNR